MVHRRRFSKVAAQLGRVNPYAGALFLTAIALLFALALPEATGKWSASSILLMAVLASAVLWGFWRGVLAGVIAALCYDYFFIPPLYRLDIDNWRDALSLAIFVLAAAAVSGLAEAVKRKTIEARRGKILARRLYGLSQRLRTAQDITTVASEVTASVGACLGTQSLLLLHDKDGLRIAATHPQKLTLSEMQRDAVARACASALLKPNEAAQEEGLTCLPLPVRLDGGEEALLVAGPAVRRIGQQPHRMRLMRSLAEQGAVALTTVALAKRAEDARITAEAEKLRSALLTSLSHDLKAPLAVILGSASSLHELRPRLSETEAHELLLSILSEAERLNQFIANLLDMSRVESNAVMPKRQPTDLGDVIGSAVLRTKPLLAGRRIVTQIQAGIPDLELDPVLMEKALYNILENAAHYTPPGSEITLTASVAPDSVLVRVFDEGQGIAPHDLPHIFEKFYQGDLGARKPKGTGLGLSITRGFLQAMGASVTASPRKDRSGMVFTIEVPLHRTQKR